MKYSILLLVIFCGCQRLVFYQDTTHLQCIDLSMANYKEATGEMPSNITDKDGKPLLSWRVALLKHGADQDIELYKQFKLDEPWNSLHNLKVAQTVPFEYIDPKGPKCTPLKPEPNTPLWIMNPKAINYTPYLGVTGPNAAFRPDKPRKYDKKDQHAVVVVVDKSDVLWTEPRDIPIEIVKTGNVLRWYGKETIYLTGSISVISRDKLNLEYEE